MLHLYEGDGKGKTTAAVGLSVRALGAGQEVLFCQFLKAGASSELRSLRLLGAVIETAPHNGKFTFRMTPAELEDTKTANTAYFTELARTLPARHCDLIVLDEILDAINIGLIPLSDLLALIAALPGREIVLTGRGPAAELVALADYHTEFRCHAHPYQKGAPARRGVEF